MFTQARRYIKENNPGEWDWAINVNAETFRNLKLKSFLGQYCHVVYVSGFKVAIIQGKFSDLEKAFKGFDIQAICRMRTIKPVLRVFRNERKANSFKKGCRAIAAEGFSAFKKRLGQEGIDMLEELPGIGLITKKHLAKNIGFRDVAKPDIWLKRAAKHCHTSVDELVNLLSENTACPAMLLI